MDRLGCSAGKLLVMYGQAKVHTGEKSERPSLECLVIKWVHQVGAMLQKRVPLMNRKQLMACFILSHIFVIEALLFA